MTRINLQLKFFFFSLCVAASIGVLAWEAYSGIFSIMRFNDAAHVAETLVQNHLSADRMHAAMRGDVLEGIMAAKDRDAQKFQHAAADLDEHGHIFASRMTDSLQLAIPDSIRSQLTLIAAKGGEYERKARTVLANADGPNFSAAYTDMAQAYTSLEKDQNEAGAAIHSWANQTSRNGSDLTEQTLHVIMLSAALAMLLAASIPFYARGSLFKPLRRSIDAMQRLAEGDVDIDTSFAAREDEIGEAGKALKLFRASAVARRKREEPHQGIGFKAQPDAQALCTTLAGDFEAGMHSMLTTVARTAAELHKVADTMEKSVQSIVPQISGPLLAAPAAMAKAYAPEPSLGTAEPRVREALMLPENHAGFLLISAGKSAPKAVPIELVQRLEEIDVKTLESNGAELAARYRGGLMRLALLDPAMQLPKAGQVQVVVFHYDKKHVGLVVGTILDTVHATFDVQLPSKNKTCLGSITVGGQKVEIIDVSYLIENLVGMVDMSGVNLQEAKQSHLLLVEDSPFFRNITQPFLAAVGYRVTTAKHGAEALSILKENPSSFKLIVTDIEMPVMNGYAFARACKAIPELAGIPMIAYTSEVSLEVRKKCQDVGISTCIVKTDRETLLECVAAMNGTLSEAA